LKYYCCYGAPILYVGGGTYIMGGTTEYSLDA